MLPTIKRKKKRMKRQRGKRGRSEGSVVLSRGVNAIVVLLASSLTMRRFVLSLSFCSCILSCFFICHLLCNVIVIIISVVIVVWEV